MKNLFTKEQFETMKAIEKYSYELEQFDPFDIYKLCNNYINVMALIDKHVNEIWYVKTLDELKKFADCACVSEECLKLYFDYRARLHVYEVYAKYTDAEEKKMYNEACALLPDIIIKLNQFGIEIPSIPELGPSMSEAKFYNLKKKNTDYCIIDHVGALESADIMKACYKLAFSISEKKDTYTMKGFCQKISRSPNTRVSDKQKNFVRFNKHPEEVILICNDFNTSAQWIADIWAEKTDKLTVIEGSTIEVYTIQDIHPAWFSERYEQQTISFYRRCANIWANALGWTFSAPLFKDNKVNSSENFVRNKIKAAETEHKEDLSKVSTRPDSYLQNKAIASEEECKQFFEHYRWLWEHDMLAEALEPGYALCPECGRPVRETAEECTWCDTQFEAINYTSFYEDSYNDDEDDNYEPQHSVLPETDMLKHCGNVDTAALAEKKYKTYLADCRMRDNNTFYFPKANAIEEKKYSTMALPTLTITDTTKDLHRECDPEGDSTIHQLYWKRILEDEAETQYLMSRGLRV